MAKSKGRVTIPTDMDVVKETLELMNEWGADAIRDCDGTEFPQELRDTGAKVYATYYTTRKDNAWAKANPDEIQQMYIMTKFHTATSDTLSILGALRLIVAKELDIIPEGKWNFLWITEMPFFEYDEETGEWLAMHHPFTMPMEECIEYLDTDKGKVRAKAFDLVLNGTELSSGSMRITDCELHNILFELLGMEQEEIDAKFGFLVEAYKYAAPPHGGMGIGLDRLAMLICGADSLRDVTAFPKVQNASELMSGAPSYIDDIQLDELGINITKEEKDEQ